MVNNTEKGGNNEERNLEKHCPRLQQEEKLLRDGHSGQFLFHASTRIHEFFGVILLRPYAENWCGSGCFLYSGFLSSWGLTGLK